MRIPITEVREIVVRHFGDLGDDAVDTMTAICMAESGGDPNALNDNYPTAQSDPGSPARYDYGLAQVNSAHGFTPNALFDPDYNLACARRIYDQQGFNAWATYEAGLHFNFMPVPHPGPHPGRTRKQKMLDLAAYMDALGRMVEGGAPETAIQGALDWIIEAATKAKQP